MNDEDDSGGYGYSGSGQKSEGRRSLPSKAVIIGILFLLAYWLIWSNLGDYKIPQVTPSMNEFPYTLEVGLIGALILFVYFKMKQRKSG